MDTESENDERSQARNTWISDENYLLKLAVGKYGTSNWALVASEVPGRNAKQCHDRWNVINPNIKKGKWSEEEDQTILKSFEIFGKQWKNVLYFR